MRREINKSEELGFPEKIKDNLDSIVSVGGVLLGIFIIYMSLAYGIHQYDIGFVIFISSLLYLVFRKKLIKSKDTIEFRASKRLILLNNIVFFTSIALSVWLLHSSLYYRPVSYFILVAIACASVAFEILYANKKQWTGLILIKILLIGVTLYGGIYYEFPSIYVTGSPYYYDFLTIHGTDVPYHNVQTAIYIEKGHVTLDYPSFYSYNPYYSFPIFYLLAASASILTSLNVYDSIFSSITFLFVFSVIFVFLIGQKLINTKTGLLAALMLVFGDYRIAFGAGAIPMTLGIVFFTIILYLFIVNTPRPLYKRSFVIVLSIVLILTHTIAGFVMLVTLTSLLIGGTITKHLRNIHNEKFPIFGSTVIAFGVMLFGYWMYALHAPKRSSATFLDYVVNALYNGLTHDAQFGTVSEKVSLYVASSYFEYLLDHLGYLIFLGLGIIGTYIWLRDKDELKIPLCLTMVVLFASLYGFSLLGMRTIIPTRWFSFVYVLLALVSAYGLLKLVNLMNKQSIKVIVVVIIIFLMAFFMVTSTISNNDSPLYHKAHSERLAYKASELQGTAIIHHIFNGTYGSLTPDVISPDYNFSEDEGKLYTLRKDAFKYPMIFEEIRPGIAKPSILGDEFKIRLESNSNEIYDNGEVWGYVIKEEKNSKIKNHTKLK